MRYNKNTQIQLKELETILQEKGVPLSMLRQRCRRPQVVDARTIIADYLYTYKFWTQEEIAKLFHMKQPTISHMLQTHLIKMDFDKNYCEFATQIHKALTSSN